MAIHGVVGMVFGLFCTGLIFWHLATPLNPDHALNMAMHPTLAVLFFVSVFLKSRPSVWLQIFALALGAVLCGSVGSFHAAAAVGIVAMILLYAQGNFGTMAVARVVVASSAQFVNVSVSAWIYGQSPVVAMGHGLVWLVASILVVMIFWVGFNHMYREIVKQNHDLNEVNKKLLGELHGRRH